jgi:hypothetical protein
LGWSRLLFPGSLCSFQYHLLLSIQSSQMKFTFTAALLAVASGAAAAPADTASSVLPPPEAQSNALKGSLRGGTDRMFSRRLIPFPDEYDSNGCLGDNFKDKCANCMCLNGPIGGAYPTKHCDLSAPGDGQDHCVDKGATDSLCHANWECQSNSCTPYSFLVGMPRCK